MPPPLPLAVAVLRLDTPPRADSWPTLDEIERLPVRTTSAPAPERPAHVVLCGCGVELILLAPPAPGETPRCSGCSG